jgi:Ni/Fe-hydrogenase subunit HybB-like protein
LKANEERTLIKAFFVQRVPAFVAPSQPVLVDTVHSFVTDGTVVVGAWNSFLLVPSFCVRCSGSGLARGACICVSDFGMGDRVRG